MILARLRDIRTQSDLMFTRKGRTERVYERRSGKAIRVSTKSNFDKATDYLCFGWRSLVAGDVGYRTLSPQTQYCSLEIGKRPTLEPRIQGGTDL